MAAPALPNVPGSKVSDIVERRNDSQEWMNENYYGEFAEVYRSIHCRTEKITRKNAKGVEVEDTTRTNVCMPDAARMVRGTTARLNVNPPQINYIVPSDSPAKLTADRLTAWSYQQFNRSGEATERRKHVLQEETFGFSCSKLYWDKVQVDRRYRYDRMTFRDRAAVMQSQGASREEIEAAVGQDGPELSNDEVAIAISESGPELQRIVPTQKYEGPVCRTPFIGDVFLERGFRDINSSGFVIEQYTETDVWLQKMLRTKFKDPETGAWRPAFDKDAVRRLVESDRTITEQGKNSLREKLRISIGQSEAVVPKRLIPGKRFDILEGHEPVDGWMWIYWVGNEHELIGAMPYQWDLYGKYSYTQFVGQPDVVGGIGDSNVRLGRFLLRLRNANEGQKTDLITNILRRTGLVKNMEDVADEVVERGLFRFLKVKDPQSFKWVEERDVPAGAWEQTNSLRREMATLDPSLTNVEAGTANNPQGGKTATTALLASRAQDVLMLEKVAHLNEYERELGEKKLWMLQQQGQGEIEIAQQFIRTEALSARYGETRRIVLDPMEIQEDIQVEPEVGSTLSVDDDLRAQAAQQVYAAAQANPRVFNVPEAAKFWLSTVRGAERKADKLINPPQPPPPPEAKVSFTVNYKDLPADVQNQMLVKLGMQPSQELVHEGTLAGIEKMARAADAAQKLSEPAPDPYATPETPQELAARSR